MFAKRQSSLAAAAGAPPPRTAGLSLKPALAVLRRPAVAVTAAGLGLMATVALFVVVLGDPRAGAPSARAGLDRSAAAPAAAPSGYDAFSLGFGMGAYQDLSDPTAGGLINPGDAIITLPDGASVTGGTGVQAPVRPPSSPLAPAPIAGLGQPGPNGLLPVIAPDGRTPFQAYARPFRPNGKPRVALVVGGLGLNAAATRAAIERLPGEVTLSFVPYAEGLQGWIDQARAHGHEVMIELPMEPSNYPENDPGPYTLLAAGDDADIQAKMSWLLGRATGYFAVTNYLGDRFVRSDAGMSAVLQILRQRGLALIDDGQARQRPGAFARASADRVVDETQTPAAIVGQLNAIEALAKARGQALGAGFAYPVTVEAAARWAAGLEARGVQLAPASAIAQRPGRG